MNSRVWAAAVILALPAPGGQDRAVRKDYPKDGVAWSADWAEAMTESRWRNVPVYVAYHDDSEASVSMTRAVYADAKFIEASKMWVNVPVHSRGGHEVDVERGGGLVTVCDRFWNISCAVHVRHAAIADCFKDLKSRPAAVFTMTGLPVLGRLDGRATVSELLQAQQKVSAKWPGSRVPLAVWNEVKEIRAEGDRYFKDKAWRKSVDAYLRIKKARFGTLIELADECLRPVNEQGELLFGDAYKKTVDPKTREDAKKVLRQIVKDFSPLKVAEKAQQTLDALKSHGN
jgi:hypothetical protein